MQPASPPCASTPVPAPMLPLQIHETYPAASIISMVRLGTGGKPWARAATMQAAGQGLAELWEPALWAGRGEPAAR